ncbi:hypothetical protein CEXT_164871 [Caerostris extrusa]|uniref:Uncharacterized protein n=1 Tax=Caerostris extrusa TaxID=172846 RepID=A0AAV4YEI3_CAEEX|nr:hypothetical protein CEXT_164871 [Caerostris extrusa]
MLKIFIWMYCLFVTSVTVFFRNDDFQLWDDSSKAAQTEEFKIVAAHLKRSHRGHFERFYFFTTLGFLQYFVLLLITLTPAAAVQPVCDDGEGISSVFARLDSKRYSIIKALICRSFMGKTSLTLWKIYRIDNSLLISAIGTLISYGILVGTLGSVQSSNNEN